MTIERKTCLTPDKYRGDSCSHEPYCDNCREWLAQVYPQGWDYYAGDTCKHGVYVGGMGIDWMCAACEAWDDDTDYRRDTSEDRVHGFDN